MIESAKSLLNCLAISLYLRSVTVQAESHLIRAQISRVKHSVCQYTIRKNHLMIFDLCIQLFKIDQIVLHQHLAQPFKVFEHLISKVCSLRRVLKEQRVKAFQYQLNAILSFNGLKIKLKCSLSCFPL